MADLRYGEQSLQNFTPLMDLVPRQENMLERMGLFSEAEYKTEKLTTFERRVLGIDTMYSVARGADRQYAGDDEAQTAHLEIPFFTLDKVIKPSDVDQLREFLTATDPETVRSRVEKVIARIQRGHAELHKNVMYEAVVNNKTYAKDKAGNDRANLVKNFQAVWAIPNADMFNGAADGAASIDLTDQTTNPADTIEAFRKHIFNKAGDGGDNYRIIILMGSQAFTDLKNHSDYVEAFANYASQEEPLRQRLGGLRTSRVLEWQGVTYVEDVSGKIADNQLIGFPLDMEDMFQLHYGHADTIAAQNGDEEVAEAYLYIREDARKVGVESEAALLANITRPELIARWTQV